jgi:ParB-like chromosome segregation protein Spo0J
VVIVGHTRLEAARVLGLAAVPVHVAENLSPSQVKAYRLADNRTHEESEWDEDLLSLELGDLHDLDFDLGLTGFDADEIARALACGAEGLTDPDEVPAPARHAREPARGRVGSRTPPAGLRRLHRCDYGGQGAGRGRART